MIVVLSHGHLASVCCLGEECAFLQNVRERRRGGHRVFVVELDDLDRDKCPDGLRDLVSYSFWAPGSDGLPRRMWEAGLRLDDTGYSDYLVQLDKLAERSPRN